MSALLKLAGKLPGWAYLVVALLVAGAIGSAYLHAHGFEQGRAAVQALWDADKKARATAETKAVAQRVAKNLVQARQQAATALAITKDYDEEINDVRASLAAERMRKPAFCASAGPPATAGTSGARSGDEADPAGGLLADAVARDIQALILQTEEVAATGRACQAFVQENGMAP